MERESRLRRWMLAGLAAALVGSVMAIAGPGVASGQETAPGSEPADCPVTSMGTLGASTDSAVHAEGRWTTEDCDSRFRPGNDAHTFSFQVRGAGRIRIELTSTAADPYLYLLAVDGTRLADDDDGGAGLSARVERDLLPGVYLVEATTVGGRGRGAADFTLSAGRVAGCDTVQLGTLEADVDLTAMGSWSLDTCGSRIVASHPAYNYSFALPADGRVRIDLTSESGDPVLSLASLEGAVIGANDDGGGALNSRIEQYLAAGVYFIEATTYLARDLQPLRADFTLTVHLVDESARQEGFQLKVEKVAIPDEVVAGDPVTVDYRVGNAGGGDLPGRGEVSVVYVVGRVEDGRRVSDFNGPVAGADGRWPARTSYHSDDAVASATSEPNLAMRPLEVTFDESGPAWLFVGIFTEDEDRNELGFHGVWNNLTVLSGPTFGPVEVTVDGAAYSVAAEADAEGTVTTSVLSVDDSAAEIDEAVRARAVYTAGVYTQLLDGVFERPALAALAGVDEPFTPVVALPSDPSSGSLLETFGVAYATLIGSSGPAESVAEGEAISPLAAEELVLAVAARASGRFTALASSWRALLGGLEEGAALRPGEALSFQSELAYTEAVVAPAATAGRIVAAARAAETHWEDPGVRAMIAELGSCGGGRADLAVALAAATQAAVDELLVLDTEMRAALPVWGPAVDAILCAAAAADAANFRFLERLALDESEELLELLLSEEEPTEEDPAPQSHRLRVIARLGAGGRVEHGVELLGGHRLLPGFRYLRADAPADEWVASSAVELDGEVLGRIRARRLADGRTEMGFVAGGEEHLPDIRYLPADPPEGVWFYSSEIEVAPAPSG
ncbi:MAG: PPC domain-containing protein [bacterium]|nr:PPC domain-containing protein [bacterium]